jgi:hypothetical protein
MSARYVDRASPAQAVFVVYDTRAEQECIGTAYSRRASAAAEAEKLNRLYESWMRATELWRARQLRAAAE